MRISDWLIFSTFLLPVFPSFLPKIMSFIWIFQIWKFAYIRILSLIFSLLITIDQSTSAVCRVQNGNAFARAGPKSHRPSAAGQRSADRLPGSVRLVGQIMQIIEFIWAWTDFSETRSATHSAENCRYIGKGRRAGLVLSKRRFFCGSNRYPHFG